MRGAPFSCKGERVMPADERSPKPRFFFRILIMAYNGDPEYFKEG